MKTKMKESLGKLWEDMVKFGEIHPYAALIFVILMVSGITGIHVLRILFMLIGSADDMM